MRRTFLKSKIHRARVTAADLHYEGSITIDRRLLEAADIHDHERVQVVDITNGARLETYAIAGGPGEVQINGAAAHLVDVGDLVIIMSWAALDEHEIEGWEPRVIVVDADNRGQRSDLEPLAASA